MTLSLAARRCRSGHAYPPSKALHMTTTYLLQTSQSLARPVPSSPPTPQSSSTSSSYPSLLGVADHESLNRKLQLDSDAASDYSAPRAPPFRPPLNDITHQRGRPPCRMQTENDPTLQLESALTYLDSSADKITLVTNMPRRNDNPTGEAKNSAHRSIAEKTSMSNGGVPESVRPTDVLSNSTTSQQQQGGQGAVDSPHHTKRIAAIAGGAAGAAVVAVIAMSLFALFRRRRSRRKQTAAFLKHQQLELDAQHDEACQFRPFASDLDAESRMLAMNDHPPLGSTGWCSPVTPNNSLAQASSTLPTSHCPDRRLLSVPSPPPPVYTNIRHATMMNTQNPAVFTSPRNAAYEHSRKGSPYYHPDLGPEFYTGFPIVLSPCMQQTQDQNQIYRRQQSLSPLSPPPSPPHQCQPSSHCVLPLPHDPERFRFYYEQSSLHPLHYHPAPPPSSAQTIHVRHAHPRTFASLLPPQPSQPLPPLPSPTPSHEHQCDTVCHVPKDTTMMTKCMKAAVDLMTLHDELNDHSPEFSGSLPPPPRTPRPSPRSPQSPSQQSPLRPQQQPQRQQSIAEADSMADEQLFHQQAHAIPAVPPLATGPSLLQRDAVPAIANSLPLTAAPMITLTVHDHGNASSLSLNDDHHQALAETLASSLLNLQLPPSGVVDGRRAPMLKRMGSTSCLSPPSPVRTSLELPACDTCESSPVVSPLVSPLPSPLPSPSPSPLSLSSSSSLCLLITPTATSVDTTSSIASLDMPPRSASADECCSTIISCADDSLCCEPDVEGETNRGEVPFGPLSPMP